MPVTGMAIGTVFTLFILPVVYMLLAADDWPQAAKPAPRGVLPAPAE
jgi:hypothetical protein